LWPQKYSLRQSTEKNVMNRPDVVMKRPVM
jgi:hypothetical protein